MSTAGSLALELFPLWLKTLGLPETAIQGHDIPVRGPREAFREIVRRIREESRTVGALVTTHKMDILAAAEDLFDSLDPYARAFREVSGIAKRGGALHGSAKDPFSSGLAPEDVLPPHRVGRVGRADDRGLRLQGLPQLPLEPEVQVAVLGGPLVGLHQGQGQGGVARRLDDELGPAGLQALDQLQGLR